jgi:hypothetical protein
MSLMQSRNIPINNDIFNQYSEVNRLIIIGNGFDLAHGFKSSFLDFIKDYLIKILINISDNLSHKDKLISIKSRVIYQDLRLNYDRIDALQLFKLFDEVKKRKDISVRHESELLNKIITSINEKSWVDIE